MVDFRDVPVARLVRPFPDPIARWLIVANPHLFERVVAHGHGAADPGRILPNDLREMPAHLACCASVFLVIIVETLVSPKVLPIVKTKNSPD